MFYPRCERFLVLHVSMVWNWEHSDDHHHVGDDGLRRRRCLRSQSWNKWRPGTSQEGRLLPPTRRPNIKALFLTSRKCALSSPVVHGFLLCVAYVESSFKASSNFPLPSERRKEPTHEWAAEREWVKCGHLFARKRGTFPEWHGPISWKGVVSCMGIHSLRSTYIGLWESRQKSLLQKEERKKKRRPESVSEFFQGDCD